MCKIIINKFTKLKDKNILDNIYRSIKNKNDYTRNDWISEINDNKLLNWINEIRNSKIIYRELEKIHKNCKIINIKEMDEIYYSTPPKNINSLHGDKSVYMQHIDGLSPFIFTQTYRIILSLSNKRDVYTAFPNENKVIQLDKYEFVGFNFNNEVHYVSGNLKSNEERILLKFHYIICHPKTLTPYINLVYNYNIYFEYFTRFMIRSSTNPKTTNDKIIGDITIFGTFLRLNLIYICFTLLSMLISYNIGKYSLENKVNIENKEIKENIENIENKENIENIENIEIKEIKEIKENIEIKEIKEIKENKVNIENKEIKENIEIKEIKENKNKMKNIRMETISFIYFNN